MLILSFSGLVIRQFVVVCLKAWSVIAPHALMPVMVLP